MVLDPADEDLLGWRAAAEARARPAFDQFFYPFDLTRLFDPFV